MLAVEPEAHRVVEDRRHRGLDPLDRAAAVLVERGPGGEPDVDIGRVASGLAGAGVDPRDGVLDDVGQEPGAGSDAVADAPAQVQHLRALGADEDGNALARHGRRPADALRPALIGRFALGEEISHARHVVLDPRTRGDLVADVEDGAVPAGHVHEGPPAGQAVDRRQEGRHHLRLSRERVRRAQADARPRCAQRDQGRPDVGVASDERGIVRADRLGAVVVGHLREVDEAARVLFLQQRRPRAQADSERDFHLVSSRLATRGPPLT